MTTVSERRPLHSDARVPPHSVEAEESVLGSVLMSVDALNEVMDKLEPEDFYVPAHQSIFRAVRTLFDTNKAVDAITVSEELRRTSELERMGGVGYVTSLLDIVPSASNIEYYASIVEEHSQRRHLIKAGATVTDLALRLDDEISAVLDRAEQTVLGVAGRKVGDGMQRIGPLFFSTLEELEALEARGSEVTGLSTGFRDLDRKLTGLHPANLTIIAARPAMGKCLAGSTRITDPKTGARVTVADLARHPELRETVHVLALSLESMSLVPAAPSSAVSNGVKPVFDLRTRLGRKIRLTANHPLLTIKGWKRLDELQLGDFIGVPGKIDAIGVDRLPDAEVALLAYLIGDGSISDGTPRITNASPRVIDDVARWAGHLGLTLVRDGERVTYRLSSLSPGLTALAEKAGVSLGTAGIAMSSGERLARKTVDHVRKVADEIGFRRRGNVLKEILEDHGIWGSIADSKRVPEAVFRLPEDQLSLFLSRLYATDGSAWVSGNLYRVEYSTTSPQLARDVQHLLLRFGIVAKQRRRRVKYRGTHRVAYDVSFQDAASVTRFFERIGIFGKEAAQDLVLARAQDYGSAHSEAELLPREAWEFVESERDGLSWAEISRRAGKGAAHSWHPHRGRVTKRTMARLGEALESDLLTSFATGDVIWDRVVAIEPAGREETFDIEVPIFENFVADDIIVHNSALTANIATNVAMERKPVAFFSLEMSKEEVAQRMLCSVARIDSMKLRTGQIGETAWPRLTDAAGKLYEAPVFVDDSPVVTVTDIRAKCRRIKRQHGLDLVVVDYLQLMQGSMRENRQQEIADISRSLKNLARELEVPIIAVSQLNRNLESREDKRPRLGDLRESGSLEQDADIVIFIYRDEYYNEGTDKKGVAEVAIAKHRAGSTGVVEMTFMPEFTKFSDIGRD